jgi:hypothetical protein
MRTVLCRWCGALATGTVTARGLDGPVPHCDGCWERTWKLVRDKEPRTWKLIEQPEGLF